METTSIGSFPHKEASEPLYILKETVTVPAWPQLPKADKREGMYTQFCEGMPNIFYKEADVYLGKGDEQMLQFYQNWCEENVDYFKISPLHARGFYKMMEIVEEFGAPILKGQVIGPISFGLQAKREDGKSIIYDETLFDVALKVLCMKGVWQIREFKKVGKQALIFIDEPYLALYGSAVTSISRDFVTEALEQIISRMKKEGAVCGIHCCANTDWSLIFRLGVDIISFDAYNFSEYLLLYKKELNDFLNKGGKLCIGIVPTVKEQIEKESMNSLKKKLHSLIKHLSSICSMDEEQLKIQCMLSPTCGTSSLPEHLCKKVFNLLKALR
jgi:hypothetical protein